MLVLQVHQMMACKFLKTTRMINRQEDRDNDRHNRNLVLGSERQCDSDSEITINELNIVETIEEHGLMDAYLYDAYNPWS